MNAIKNIAMVGLGGAIALGGLHILTGGESTELLKAAFSDKILHKGADVAETIGDIAENLTGVSEGVTI